MLVRIVAAAAVAVAVAGGLGLGACGRREPHEPPRETPRANRVIEPSNDRVGPLPPYAIRADGVGPYKLGEKLSDLLEKLASGPRIALFEIPGVVHRNVIRAEDDAILIGGEQASTASFVAVVGSDVARIESVHVGATRDELIAALGPPIEDPERARDPRLVVPTTLPGLRAVLDGDRVAAIVVASAAPPQRRIAECQRPAATDTAIGACLTAAGELLQIAGGDISVRSADGERAVAPPLRLPGLVFAAPLRTADRDELVAITRSDEPAGRGWWLAAYRLEGGRLVRSIDAAQLYQLSADNARWIGAELRDVDLYLELATRADGIEVGGLLTTRGSQRTGAKIRDVVVISTTTVQRRRPRPASTDNGDGGSQGSARVSPDAGALAPDAAGAESATSTP